LQAIGQAPDRGLADVLDLEEVDDLLDLGLRCSSSSRCAGPSQKACCSMLAFIFRLRPVMMLSSTDMPLNKAMFWKVRASPALAALWEFMLREMLAAQDDLARPAVDTRR
jgi:hypothetical protein